MVYVGSGFEIIIYCGKIVKTIADGYNPGYPGLTGLLNDNELLNRVFNNQTHMGMSIKILHGLVHKEKNVFYSKLDFIMIAHFFPGVNVKSCLQHGRLGLALEKVVKTPIFP
jgi:hypothetical protein